MKFRVTKACVIQGIVYSAGDEADIEYSVAKSLLGKLLSADAPEPENRSVGLEASDEVPVKRGKKQSD